MSREHFFDTWAGVLALAVVVLAVLLMLSVHGELLKRWLA